MNQNKIFITLFSFLAIQSIIFSVFLVGFTSRVDRITRETQENNHAMLTELLDKSYASHYLEMNPGADLLSTSNKEALSKIISEVLHSQLPVILQNVGGVENNDASNVVSNHKASKASVYKVAKELSDDEVEIQEQAAVVSHSVLDRSISAGEWTAEDTREVQSHIHQLSETQYLKVLERFHEAVNSQKITLHSIPPL